MKTYPREVSIFPTKEKHEEFEKKAKKEGLSKSKSITSLADMWVRGEIVLNERYYKKAN